MAAAAIAAAAVPILTGILGTAGQMQTNRANRDMAREQMNFQERMSNTAAQRSVKDYIAAGLNPGLAYEHVASSPGGATATMGDPINSGIASAMRTKELQQGLQIARQQSDKDLKVKDKQIRLLEKQGNLAEVNTTEADRMYRFNQSQEPMTRRLQAADTQIREYALPGLKNEANFETRLAGMKQGLNSAMMVMQLVKALNKD